MYLLDQKVCDSIRVVTDNCGDKAAASGSRHFAVGLGEIIHTAAN
jgi:hypothetical protein